MLIGNVMEEIAVRRPSRAVSSRQVESCMALPTVIAANMIHFVRRIRLVDEENKQKIIIDFSNVKFLSSHALGIILTLHKKAKGVNGSLCLCGVRKELMKVFTLTDLDKIFRFYPDDKAALAAHHVTL